MIRCTDTHPFQVKDKGWVKAEKLQPGDLVYDKDWNTSPVERVEIIHLAEPVEVFNFEVEDCHTYYIGSGEWIVHNGACHNSQWNAERRRHWREQSKLVPKGTDNGIYIADQNNLDRMARGLAPKGKDGFSVVLHHPEGIANNFPHYVEMTRTNHILWHMQNGWFR